MRIFADALHCHAVTRKRLLSVVKSFNVKSTDGVAVDRDQSIFVRGTALLELPVTTTRLISSIVAMLFDLNPVLRSLADHLPGLAQTIPNWGSNSADDRRDQPSDGRNRKRKFNLSRVAC